MSKNNRAIVDVSVPNTVLVNLKNNMQLKIIPQRAFGYKAEQTWYFIQNIDNPHFIQRAVILRKYCANGSVWFGIRFQEITHENGLPMLIEEIKLAQKAIKILRKSWKKYLSE